MKKFLMAATALSMVLTGSMAMGQRWDRDRDGRHDRWDRHDNRRDDRRDWRRENWRASGWRDNRGRDWRHYGRYNRGQRFRGDGIYISDYDRYGWGAPPRGYRYYRTDSGDVVMAAIATGLIASVIASSGR